MNKQLLKVGAVAAALLPVSGFAAIDDQGMQYVSAAEGLNGSLRVDILLSTDDEAEKNTDESVIVGGAENSLRLWVNGSSDLGGGLSSTYYWEMRNEDGAVETHSWDLGLSGPWGEAEFGRLAMVAYRLVPSASLAFERGTERGSPGCDPCDNGLRYESPSINGFKFGVSGIIADVEGSNDDAADEYSFAMSYDSPIGLKVGAGYEVVNLPEGTEVNVGLIDVDDPTKGFHNVAGDKTGFRFGARYGQDNWLVGYEYRNYEGYWAYSEPTGVVLNLIGLPDALDDLYQQGFVEQNEVVAWNKNAEYDVHAFGVQVKIDRITASAGFSSESQSLKLGEFNLPLLDREVFSADMAYSLGSRSTMVVGWRSTETDSIAVLDGNTPLNIGSTTDLEIGHTIVNGPKETNEKSEIYLFYRVDF